MRGFLQKDMGAYDTEQVNACDHSGHDGFYDLC